MNVFQKVDMVDDEENESQRVIVSDFNMEPKDWKN
jgi:hypothetical protein